LRLTYNQANAKGVRRGSISPGIYAMVALGLIAVDRAPFNAGAGRYAANQYRLVNGWVAFEPENASPKGKKAALARAKERAAIARKSKS